MHFLQLKIYQKLLRKRVGKLKEKLKNWGARFLCFSLIKDEKMIISRTDVLEVQDEG